MIRRKSTIVHTAHVLETANGAICFDLIRSRRRSISITVDEQAQVKVQAPLASSEDTILSFLREKTPWIVRKYTDAVAHYARVKGRQFDSGHVFLFLGKYYPLDTYESAAKRCRIHFDGHSWRIGVPIGLSPAKRQGCVKDTLVGWYRLQAEEVVASRMFHYARIVGVEPQKIAVRTQKRVWGNCDHRGKIIHINWHVVLAPIEIIDYIVVHELCHLLIANHSARFWQKVAQFMPAYKEHKKWLRDNAVELTLLT